MYDVIIRGATAAALGLAGALGGRAKVLIINDNQMVAGEFVNAFRNGTGWDKPPVSPAAATLGKALADEGLLDGDIRVYSAGPVLCRAFEAMEADLLLDTAVTQMKQTQDGWALSLVNGGGHSRVQGRIYVDTTGEGIAVKSRCLRAILTTDRAQAAPPDDGGGLRFTMESGGNPPVAHAAYDCADSDSLMTASHGLIEAWRRRGGGVWRIAAIALCFDEIPQDGIWVKGNRAALPSALYPNILAAVDAGYEFAGRLSL